MASEILENGWEMEINDSGDVNHVLMPGDSKGPIQLLDLSDDVLLCILRMCTPQDLKALGHTCRRLGILICDHTLWQRVDARSAPTGIERMSWYLTHGLSSVTKELKLTGYADKCSRCLGVRDLSTAGQLTRGCADDAYCPRLNAKIAGRNSAMNTQVAPNTAQREKTNPNPNLLSRMAFQSVVDASSSQPSTSKYESGIMDLSAAGQNTGTAVSNSNEESASGQNSGTSDKRGSGLNSGSATPNLNDNSASGKDSGTAASNLSDKSASGQDLDIAVSNLSDDSASSQNPASDTSSSTDESASGQKPNTAASNASDNSAASCSTSNATNDNSSTTTSNSSAGTSNTVYNALLTNSDNSGTAEDNKDDVESTLLACRGKQYTVNPKILRSLGNKCQNLTFLALEYCNLDYMETSLIYFPITLKKLSLKGSWCYNVPEYSSYFHRVHYSLPKLEYLDVSECDWYDAKCMVAVSKLPHLRELYMKHCRRLTECVEYATLAARNGFKRVRIVDLRGSPVGDQEVSAFGWLPVLEELYCSPPLKSVFMPAAVHSHKPGEVLRQYSELEEWEKQEPDYFKCKTPPPELLEEDEESEISTETVPERTCNEYTLGSFMNWALSERLTHVHYQRDNDIHMYYDNLHQQEEEQRLEGERRQEEERKQEKEQRREEEQSPRPGPSKRPIIDESLEEAKRLRRHIENNGNEETLENDQPGPSTRRIIEVSGPAQVDMPPVAIPDDACEPEAKSDPPTLDEHRQLVNELIKTTHPSNAENSASSTNAQRASGDLTDGESQPRPLSSYNNPQSFEFRNILRPNMAQPSTTAGLFEIPQFPENRGPNPSDGPLAISGEPDIEQPVMNGLPNIRNRPVNHHLGRYLRRLYLPALLRGEGQPLVQFFFQPHFVYYLVSDMAVLGFGRAKSDLIRQLQIANNLRDPLRHHQTNLRVLSITGYRDITDKSLEYLARSAPHIMRVDFSHTNVTAEGVEAFKAAKPNCEVVFCEVMNTCE